MRKQKWPALAIAVLAVMVLGGCGTNGSAPPVPTTQSSATTPSSAASPVAGGAVLKTSSSALGTIVVNGQGFTVYVYDMDTANSGVSACTGPCLSLWPAVMTTSAKPVVTGVTGTIGTITRPEGGMQVTVNGLPLYTYTPDAKAGDVTGQGYGGIWWVVGPNGAKVTQTAAPSTPAANSGY